MPESAEIPEEFYIISTRQARPGVLGIRYPGCFLVRYSVFFCQNVGIKYFSPEFLVFCIKRPNVGVLIILGIWYQTFGIFKVYWYLRQKMGYTGITIPPPPLAGPD